MIIPEEEETQPNLELLDDWRIWQTKTPMLLSLVDDKEILVGGALDSQSLVALVSEDQTYLQLYHDILGPRLISGRISR